MVAPRTEKKGRRNMKKQNEAPEQMLLIVDDQADDQMMLKWMLEKLGVTNPVRSLHDGHEVVRYLNGDGPYADREKFPMPTAMFLDLQMPVMSGWQELDWIQSTGMKGQMRIFVYSAPANVSEVNKLYRMGADSFIQKPASEREMLSLIENFPEPWKLAEAVIKNKP